MGTPSNTANIIPINNAKRDAASPARLILLLICLFLTACAAPGKRLEPPRVSLVNIEVEEATMLETAFNIQLRIFNTNETDLILKGADCMLEVNGKDFAQGVADTRATIPAYGTGKVSMTVYTSLIDVVRGLLTMPGSKDLRYRLKGRLRAEGGFLMPSVLPFSSEGSIELDRGSGKNVQNVIKSLPLQQMEEGMREGPEH